MTNWTTLFLKQHLSQILVQYLNKSLGLVTATSFFMIFYFRLMYFNKNLVHILVMYFYYHNLNFVTIDFCGKSIFI